MQYEKLKSIYVIRNLIKTQEMIRDGIPLASL